MSCASFSLGITNVIQRKCLHLINNGEPIALIGNFSTDAINECKIHVSRRRLGSTKIKCVAVKYNVPMRSGSFPVGYGYMKRTFSTCLKEFPLVKSKKKA